jgi:hypothetical protein
MSETRTARDLLRPDEHLLWEGRPDPNVWFTRADVFLVPFSLLWAWFIASWSSEILSGSNPVVKVFVAAFALAGLYLVVGRFIYKAIAKRRTIYAITNRRAVAALGSEIIDCAIEGQQADIRRSRDGRHLSVTFGRPAKRGFFAQANYYGNTGMEIFARGPRSVAFYDVDDATALSVALDQARWPTKA